MATLHAFPQPPRCTPRRGPLTAVLYGGPGTGKSTTAAAVFAELKQRGHNVELVTEFAKDLTWEQAHGKLAHQPYLTAKQMWRLDRLTDQVQAVVTDTSTLLSTVYGGPENGVTPAFREWLIEDYLSRRTVNFFLQRDPSRAYNTKGRSQTETEAVAADSQIRRLLHNLKITHYTIHLSKGFPNAVQEISDIVEYRL